MKRQVLVSDHQSAQHAIDVVKSVFKTGKPHVLTFSEPSPQASGKARQAAMTIISGICDRTGNDVEDVEKASLDAWKIYLLRKKFGPKYETVAGEEIEVPRSLRELEKDELSEFISWLDHWAATET